MKKIQLLACLFPLMLSAQQQWVCFTGSDGITDYAFGNEKIWTSGAGGLSSIDLSTGATDNLNNCNSPLIGTSKLMVAIGADGAVWTSDSYYSILIRKPDGPWDNFSKTADGQRFNQIFKLLPINSEKGYILGWLFNNQNSGLLTLENGEINAVSIPSGFNISYGSANFVDAAGNFWIGDKAFAGGAIGKFDGNEWTVFDSTDFGQSMMIRDLAQTPDGNIWAVGISEPVTVNSTIKLLKFDGINWSLFTEFANPMGSSIYYISIEPDGDGNLWTGGFDGKFLKFNPNTTSGDGWEQVDVLSIVGLPPGDPDDDFPIFGFRVAPNGDWWFYAKSTTNYSSYDLCTYSNGELKVLNNLGNSKIPTNNISEVTIGPDNQKYMIANGNLLRFDPNLIGAEWTTTIVPSIDTFKYFQSRENLVFDKKGNQWFTDYTGDSSRIVRFDGQSLSFFPVYYESGYPLYNFKFDVDEAGNAWVPLWDKFLKIDPAGNKTYVDLPGNDLEISLIYRDRFDKLWATAGPDIFKQEGGNWQKVAGLNDNGQNNYWVDGWFNFFVDKNDVAWMTPANDGGSQSLGLFKLENGTLERVKATIPSLNMVNRPIYLSSLAVDSSNNLWGNGGGLFKFDGTNWTVYTILDSGYPGGVNNIAIDAFQNIWMSGSAGLTVFNENGVTNLGFKTNQPGSINKLGFTPNPVSNETKVEFPISGIKGLVEWSVYDAVGHLVFSKPETESTGILNLDMKEFASGVYHVKAVTNAGKFYGKLVKQ